MERTRETVVGHAGKTTTAESLTAADGAHTLYLARRLERSVGMLVVSNVETPFYAVPNVGDLAVPGDMVPEDKKLYSVSPATASEYYRDFGPFRSTGLRTVGEMALSDFDTQFETELTHLAEAQFRFLGVDPTPLARALGE